MVEDIVKQDKNHKIDALNLSCYDNIAFEYDSAEHATCRNFDEANYSFLRNTLNVVSCDAPLSYLDVGVGTGVSLENIEKILEKKSKTLEDVFSQIDVIDISQNMLSVTEQKFANMIDNFFNKSILNFNTGSKYDLIISTLADPFLIDESFKKFYQLLNDDGYLVFTFPSYDWAKSINRSEIDKTIFHNSQGEKMISYSFCWSNKSILNLLDKNNFDITRLEVIKLSQIKNLSRINKKAILNNRKLNFLTGIIAKKI